MVAGFVVMKSNREIQEPGVRIPAIREYPLAFRTKMDSIYINRPAKPLNDAQLGGYFFALIRAFGMRG